MCILPYIYIIVFQGKPFTSIEPGTDLNDLCIVPDTGMLFMANEAPKILAYYVPVSKSYFYICACVDV